MHEVFPRVTVVVLVILDGPISSYRWLSSLLPQTFSSSFIIVLATSTTFFGGAHRHHHKFYNPTPFAVVADEYVDQLVRASPLLIFPLIMPVNIDVMFAVYGVFFYIYGVYLHWGYELDFPDAHHPWINTSFQHYLHHAVSTKGKPYHTGFFFKLWDQLFGSVYTDTCFCAKCETKNGKRGRDKYDELMSNYPEYSKLLSPSFWLQAFHTKGTVGKAQ